MSTRSARTDAVTDEAAAPKRPPTPPKAIAFYLPQFHPFPENDEWWGKGFTEWVNVARARALWRSHDQPHLPLDMGFYDLRLPEVQIEQAKLARSYGIYGFCYHYYWFSGRRLLHRPLEILLADKRIDIPFCLDYANQNWTGRWNGQDDDVLMRQTHDEEDDRKFIESLMPFFRDDRYIRIGARPLLLVYRTGLYPDAKRTAGIWREEAARHGFELYLCRVEFGSDVFPPAQIGFDAAVEFPPHRAPGLPPPRTYTRDELPDVVPGYAGTVVEYRDFATGMLQRPLPDYKLFRTALTGWDNTPRRQLLGDVMLNSTPDEFERWFAALARQSMSQHTEADRFVFINAWNEWGEGAHLEPCRKWGHGYLEAVKRSLDRCAEVSGPPKVSVILTVDTHPSVVERCLRALTEQSLPAGRFEAVFVDSIRAFDGRPVFDEFMRTEGVGRPFCLHEIEKGGRARASNFGIRQTAGDIIIFLSADFIPSKTLVEAHLRFHEQHREPHVVAIGGGFFPEEVRAEEFCRWLEDSGELFGVSFTEQAADIPSAFFYVANSSVKREFLSRAGAFDERFPFPAWDDYEMGLRLAAQGMKSVYLPEARATHFHRVGLPDRRKQMRWAGASAAIFDQSHPWEQPWHRSCAASPQRYWLRALRSRLKFWLTRDPRHRHACYRSILQADFVRAYARAKAGLIWS